VRSAGLGAALRAWGAALPLAVLAFLLLYVERVEGVRALRPAFGVAAALAWSVRAVLLGACCRAHVRALWPASAPESSVGHAAATARTAAWFGVGLWAWGWWLVLGSYGGPLGLALACPWLSLRGAVAPSWLARASCAEGGGWAVVRASLADSRGRRLEGAVTELLLSLGTLGLFVNLCATGAALLLLGRSWLGLDLALVDQFVSWRNPFALAAVALLSVVLLDPLRAATSAVAYVDAEVRERGLDLHAAVDAAVATPTRAPGLRTLVLVVVFSSPFVLAGVVRAQDRGQDGARPPVVLDADRLAPADEEARDAEAREDALRVLSAPEFREFEDTRGRGLRQLVERTLDWLLRQRDPIELSAPDVPSLPLPGPGVFLGLAASIVALAGLFLLVTRPGSARALGPRGGASADAPASLDPRDRAPAEWVETADALASRGQHREALRALYLATLVALDRRGALRFEPTSTNGQYLRSMVEGPTRLDFRAFTRLFDHKWYGREDTSALDYQRARGLAHRLVDGGPSRAARDAPAPSTGEGLSP